MLSPTTLAVYDFLFRFASAVKCVPFGWNPPYSVLKMYPLQGRAHWLAWLNYAVDDIVTLATIVGLVPFIFGGTQPLARVIPAIVY